VPVPGSQGLKRERTKEVEERGALEAQESRGHPGCFTAFPLELMVPVCLMGLSQEKSPGLALHSAWPLLHL
jgi:hypothetical protein